MKDFVTFVINSIGAQRVKNVCIAMRSFCEEQNIDGWVLIYWRLSRVIYDAEAQVLVLEFYPGP